MSKLKGKVAVVTGASKGIGAAIAEDLANHGASVVVNYSSSEKDAAAVVKKIEAAGGKAKAVHANIGQPGEGGKLIAAAVAEFGRIDILVNNAGVYEFVPLAETSEAQYDRMFNLNVKGLLFTTQAAAKAFGESGGVVVNISSVSAQSAMPTTAVYGATKAAVDAFTRILAAELGPRKIRVNSVLPGPVETEGTAAMAEFDYVKSTFVPQTPLGRLGQPGDIASVVSFLVSDDAAWITGQAILTSGGLRP